MIYAVQIQTNLNIEFTGSLRFFGLQMMPNNFPMPFKDGPYKGKSRAKKRKQAAQLGLAPPPTKVN